jgi:hypothetical protein
VRSWRRAAAVMCVLRRLFPPRSFAIRQHAASRVLDGAHLLTLLQQASGASNFGKAVAESNVKLEKERESLRSVRTDVAQRGQSRHPALRQGSASLPPPPCLRLPASASLPPCLRLAASLPPPPQVSRVLCACGHPGGGAGGDADHGARGGGGTPAAAQAAEPAQGCAREPARGGGAAARRVHSEGPGGGSSMLHEGAVLVAPAQRQASRAAQPDAGLPREEGLERSGFRPY